ncbi:hypothetical protein JV173_02825 [Acholeplasma equirhinis]|uniref:hypothetical protein n=1 Tax=Acholeplasma equirhinis TaxID=555393 RepID=UPI00197A9811|nr:hypothetical protein [Acholeplasma equirhinis]MBN3490442.1 hypothetical protein [Acholeplasma equirhinis]
MKINPFNKQLNIGNEIKNILLKVTDHELFQWQLQCLYSLGLDINYPEIEMTKGKIDAYLSNQISINDLTIIFEKTNKRAYQIIQNALEQMMLCFKDRSHVIKYLDFLSNFVFYSTKSNDQMIALRLKHYQLLFDIFEANSKTS